MKTQIKIIGASSLEDLQKSVNIFLLNLTKQDVLDIKYNAVLDESQFFCSCLITYVI